jgi:hypothetical protein
VVCLFYGFAPSGSESIVVAVSSSAPFRHVIITDENRSGFLHLIGLNLVISCVEKSVLLDVMVLSSEDAYRSSRGTYCLCIQRR